MDKHVLTAQKRIVVGRKVKKLRRDGFLPANIYGKKVASTAVAVPIKDFTTVFGKAGETGLVEITLEGKKLPVLIHNVQYHPVDNKLLHADFYQVVLSEKVSAKVPIEVTGDSPAVKDKLGVLLEVISEIEVEALPADLPEKIEVNVSSLAAVGEALKVNQLKVADKVRILTDGQLEVIKIAPLVSKEAEAMVREEAAAAAVAAAEAVKPAESEVVGEKKKEAAATEQTPVSSDNSKPKVS